MIENKIIINDIKEIPIKEIFFQVRDYKWDFRSSKTIYTLVNYSDIVDIFNEKILTWKVVSKNTEDQQEIEEDNSDFSIVGDIIIQQDKTIAIKMGKPTAEEKLAILEEALKQ